MSVLIDETTRENARVERVTRRNRLLTMLVTLLAVLVVGLGSWVVYDQMADSSSAVDGEIEQLLDDYLRAWETRDASALRAAVSEDYLLYEFIYEVGADGVSLADDIESGINGVLSMGFALEWNVEQVGEAIVTGDGPWFVSMRENWVVPKGTGFTHNEGIASYVIVDEGDALRIANHSWAGLGYDTE